MKSSLTGFSTFLILFICISCKSPTGNKYPNARLDIQTKKGITPLKIKFNATDSYDPDGSIIKYKFYYGDGHSAESNNGISTYTYSAPGTYYASVLVTDNKGASMLSSYQKIEVVDAGEGEISFGTPIFTGPGCPDDLSVGVTTPPGSNPKSISILFFNMTTQAGGTLPPFDSKTCQIKLPIKLPNGQAISVYKFDMRGFSFVPENGGENKLNIKYSFEGNSTEQVFETIWDSPTPEGDDFTITHDFSSQSILVSECSREVDLNIEATISTVVNDPNQFSELTLDSLDGVTALTYHIKYMPTCPY